MKINQENIDLSLTISAQLLLEKLVGRELAEQYFLACQWAGEHPRDQLSQVLEDEVEALLDGNGVGLTLDQERALWQQLRKHDLTPNSDNYEELEQWLHSQNSIA